MPRNQKRIDRKQVNDKYRDMVERTVEHAGIDPKSKQGKRATSSIIYTVQELAAEIIAKLFGE